MMNNTILIGQMELSFEPGAAPLLRGARPTRPSTARWWFNRMRAVVDAAMDRQPAPRPRPQQLHMANAYRSALAGR